jgi:hypothetical protein
MIAARRFTSAFPNIRSVAHKAHPISVAKCCVATSPSMQELLGKHLAESDKSKTMTKIVATIGIKIDLDA